MSNKSNNGITHPYRLPIAAPVNTSVKKWLPETIRQVAIHVANVYIPAITGIFHGESGYSAEKVALKKPADKKANAVNLKENYCNNHILFRQVYRRYTYKVYNG